MRRLLTQAVSLMLGLHLMTGLAPAQCCGYISPPRAPDFQNTKALYYNTCYGMRYGPNYNVMPPFPPFQGMLPGPPSQCCTPPFGYAPGCCPPGHLFPGPLFAGVTNAGMMPPGGWGMMPYPTYTGGPIGPWDPYRAMAGGPWMGGYPGYGQAGLPAATGNAADAARNAAMNAAGSGRGRAPQQPYPMGYPGYGMAGMPGYMAVPGQWAAVPGQYAAIPGQQGANGGQGGDDGNGGQRGIVAFPNHLYARSPRDFFMIDTDPRSSPFTYGLTGQASTAAAPLPPTPYEP